MLNKSTSLGQVSELFEWDKWSKEIPYINFPDFMEVRAIPPTGTGIIRYNVRHKDNKDTWCSIYLDCYDLAGCVDEPYWELYPYKGDCFRCLINETDDLLAAISESLTDQIKEIK